MKQKTESPQAALEQMIQGFLLLYPTTAERVSAIRQALDEPGGRRLRQQLGTWTTKVVPVEMLVPDVYARWRPLVRDAMKFVVSRLSASRLAPKVVEQLELDPSTPAEKRLLRFISKVPGLQKIGQVLARNRNLYPPLREALAELEDSISDVSYDDVRATVLRELGAQLEEFQVRLGPSMLAEASVSAVVPFTWRNPVTRKRDRGVFKVLKPYIPDCYAEDMGIIQDLAGHLAKKHRGEGAMLAGIGETLTEIRLLLEREVDFPGEQATLAKAARAFEAVKGVRVPRVIEPLSTPVISALSFEEGTKITEALPDGHRERERVAQRLAEALVAAPSLALDRHAIFHADPHAGNLLYDRKRRDIVILDWALTEHLSREQRRHVLLLAAKLALRDAAGVAREIMELRHRHASEHSRQFLLIRDRAEAFIERLPALHLPGPTDAMRLLDEIALEGIRFPAALLMFRKAYFTLEGVMEDIAGAQVRMDDAVTSYVLDHWFLSSAAVLWLLTPRDWIGLGLSAVRYPSRLLSRAVSRPLLTPVAV